MNPRPLSPEGTAPDATVLVIVHTRSQFLPGALESVLTQLPDPTRCRVRVIATALDPNWAATYGPRGVEFVLGESPELGAKVAQGLREATSEVVLLLEDDDRFLPGKIPAVLQRFAEDPSLTYYHNAFQTISDGGTPWTGPFHRRAAMRAIARRRRVYRPASRAPGGWGRFAGTFPGFNDSCIALRRRAFLPYLPSIARSGLLTDETLFYAAAAGGGAILQDDDVLTQVMVHPTSVSNPTPGGAGVNVDGLVEFSRRTAGARRAILDIVSPSERRDLVDLARAEVAIQDLVAACREDGSRRPAFWHPVVAALRRPRSLAVRNYPGVVGLGLLGSISPGLAHRGYRFAKRRER